MKQGSEAFKPTYPAEETEPERTADILPFKQTYNPMWAAHAKFMAETAGIKLSQKTVDIYGMLRDEKPDPTKENHSSMSDQELLAEALRIVGDKTSLDKFLDKENYPHILKPKP